MRKRRVEEEEDDELYRPALVPPSPFYRFREIYNNHPPGQGRDREENTLRAFREVIKDPELVRILRPRWVSFEDYYGSGSTPDQIFEALSAPKIGKKPKEARISLRSKEPLWYLREANEILFDTPSYLEKSNIDMPAGAFRLNLIFFLRGEIFLKRERDKRLRRLCNHCLEVFRLVEEEFFERYDPTERTHRKLVDVLFGGGHGSQSPGKQITLVTILNAALKVWESLNEGKGHWPKAHHYLYATAYITAHFCRWRSTARAILKGKGKAVRMRSPEAWGILGITDRKESRRSLDARRLFDFLEIADLKKIFEPSNRYTLKEIKILPIAK